MLNRVKKLYPSEWVMLVVDVVLIFLLYIMLQQGSRLERYSLADHMSMGIFTHETNEEKVSDMVKTWLTEHNMKLDFKLLQKDKGIWDVNFLDKEEGMGNEEKYEVATGEYKYFPFAPRNREKE